MVTKQQLKDMFFSTVSDSDFENLITDVEKLSKEHIRTLRQYRDTGPLINISNSTVDVSSDLYDKKLLTIVVFSVKGYPKDAWFYAVTEIGSKVLDMLTFIGDDLSVLSKVDTGLENKEYHYYLVTFCYVYYNDNYDIPPTRFSSLVVPSELPVVTKSILDSVINRFKTNSREPIITNVSYLGKMSKEVWDGVNNGNN